MLRRITGERIRNELELLLKEATPIRGWLKLEAIGALKNIHPHFHIKPEIRPVFDVLEGDFPQWSDDLVLIKWHLIMGQLDENHVFDVATRLLFSKGQAEAFQKTAQIVNHAEKLAHPLTKPSEVVLIFSSFSHEGLVALWILLDNPVIRQRIEQYFNEWQHVKPTITGHDLRERGLQAGPEYRIILERLKEAWLDGEIHNPDEEQLVLKRLINEVYQ
jgi:tRNA nucleotidyltransferase (CCA-adding enzyme)